MRMLGVFALIAATAAITAVGCGPDPNISGVFPTSGFLGRKVRVEVSGDVSAWSNKATVNFGEGVTVDSVSVASPSALFAEITIANTAAPGLRDVTVSDGSHRLVLKQSFELESAIDVKFQGVVAQGSIARFTITNKDFFAPFDSTSTGDGFYTAFEFPNIAIAAGTGVRLSTGSVTPFTISGTAFFDVDAAAGPLVVKSGPIVDATAGPFVVDNGQNDEVIVSSLGANLEVQARSATPLADGIAATGTIGSPFETQLYEFTPSASPSVADFVAASSDPRAQTTFALLPTSGKWGDLIAFDVAGSAIAETSASKFFVVYWDNAGGDGYTYALTANSATLTGQDETEPNNSAATAKAATFGSLITTSTLINGADEDWYSIPVAAGDIGKKVRVVTGGADPFTDTIVEVFHDTDAAGNSLGGESDDATYHENHTSTKIPANTTKVLVKVSASSFFDVANSDYTVAIYLK